MPVRVVRFVQFDISGSAGLRGSLMPLVPPGSVPSQVPVRAVRFRFADSLKRFEMRIWLQKPGSIFHRTFKA